MRGNSIGRRDVQRQIISVCLPYLFGILMLVLFGGCVGIPVPAEKQARQNAAKITAKFQSQGLPVLSTNANLSDFLQYAMLNSPRIKTAYFEWLASIERITRARSLPDPLLTYQMDIARTVESIMPGLMMEFPGPGKLGLRAEIASKETDARYYTFETEVLRAAFEVKKAYYQLYFLTDKIRVNRETIDVVSQMEQVASRQNEVGKSTLQDVLRIQMEQDRLNTEIANLEDSRAPLVAAFKAALGLKAGDPAPSLPVKFETTPLDLSASEMLSAVYERNPRLKAMEADVNRAEASVRLAAKARIPDFAVGLESDLAMAPVMYRPLFAMTLPIWRDKIAAEITEAQAMKGAAEAELSAEQIKLAVELAEKSFMFREAGRNLILINKVLLPKARQALEIARGKYLAGQTGYFDLVDAWRTVLGIELELVEARTRRELALAELSLLVAVPPAPDTPILKKKETKSGASHAK
ncbi:MAG: TolC family protein [Kiritimatiellia bacterium]